MGDTGLTGLLFSGGLDSVALAHLCTPDVLIFIDYGQCVAQAERRAATYFAGALSLPLIELNTDLRCTGAGSLARADPASIGNHPEWWPFRNQLLISIAAAWAVSNGLAKLLIGTVRSDSCFADGTRAFVDAMSTLLAIQEGALRLEAPAIGMESLELVRASKMPSECIPMCFSCNVSVRPCGCCRSCMKFMEAMELLSD